MLYKSFEEDVKNLVQDFSVEKLKDILLLKFKSLYFNIYENRLYSFQDERFPEILEIFQVKLKHDNLLKCYSIKVNGELSERSSKKKQFELAKKILKTDPTLNAGIFTFYDNFKNFRISLVYKVYLYGKTDFSYFKRYTYFIEKDRVYRTFLKAIIDGDFSSLNGIIDAFSPIPLTKEFFTEIQNWYAWALKYSYFPGGKLEENLIRLITRLIFVWFLKEKKLIPQKIFNENELYNIVKDFKKGDYYYNVILQNLFFATLNRYPNERGFANHGSFIQNRNDFGVKTLYRYKDKILISEDKFLEIFADVPFVNGGLFECLDEDSDYIDGFTRREDKRAKIPDFLFFSQEKEEDLSSFYGEKRKVKVRGLINILKDYNFTVDESSPIDIEVSLDPELLGHIFENLLATYNPETQTTARKATGSYYTPKEIVDFMVEEALLEYFKTNTTINEDKLKKVLGYEEVEIDFTDKEKKELINSIDSLRVIDPAVGSGAFPMGVLHKLVHILNKIDPDNNLWQELQYQKLLNEVQYVSKIKDEDEKEKLIKELNENFDDSFNYPDYSRKLYIIENSIYGVDVQNIAIQISKLRFFLSLIIDQKVDKSKGNWGIKPLPHLETKFITANTLVSLEKPQLVLLSEKLKNLKEDLKNIYKRFFKIKTRKEKKNLKEKVQKIKNEIKEELERIGFSNITVQKIAEFDIFSQVKGNDWFDPEWMFGLDGGFDIVIGNPPYVRQEKIRDLKQLFYSQSYKTFTSTADLYVYFYEKGYQILKEKGILSFISSNKWMRAKYGEKLRKFLKENTNLIKLVDFGGYRVFEQTVDTCIVIFRKEKPSKDWTFKYCTTPSDIKNPIEYIKENWQEMKQEKLSDNAWTLADDKVLELKEKIEKMGKPLKDWDVKIYRGILTGFNDAFIIDTKTRNKILANCKTEEERKRTQEIIKPVLRGRDIERWRYKWAGLWLIYIPWHFPLHENQSISGASQKAEEEFKKHFPSLYNHLLKYKVQLSNRNKEETGIRYEWYALQRWAADYYPEFEKEKIVWQRVTKKFSFCFVSKGLYILDSMAFMTGENLKFILAILNSKLTDFYVKTYVHQYADTGFLLSNQYVEKIYIPPITSQNQHIVKQIEVIVEKILALTQDPTYDTDTKKQSQLKALENQIDQLVYELYNLTDEEIKIIEGESNG